MVAIAGKTEALILGNGPSLLGRAWGDLPRRRLLVCGVNQSWRVFPGTDMHVFIDADQLRVPGAPAYYADVAARGGLYHTGSGGTLGVRLDRHDELKFGRYPFRKRHRGHRPAPPLSEDGGVALKVDHDGRTGASSAYFALQIVCALGNFSRIWIAGLDMGSNPTKFTGQHSNCWNHDKLWAQVPPDVKERVRVIGPSATQQLTIVEWPWGHGGSDVLETEMVPAPLPLLPLAIHKEAPCW